MKNIFISNLNIRESVFIRFRDYTEANIVNLYLSHSEIRSPFILQGNGGILEIENFEINNNTFIDGGNLLEANKNTNTIIEIKKFQFENNTINGNLIKEFGLTIDNCTFLNNKVKGYIFETHFTHNIEIRNSIYYNDNSFNITLDDVLYTTGSFIKSSVYNATVENFKINNIIAFSQPIIELNYQNYINIENMIVNDNIIFSHKNTATVLKLNSISNKNNKESTYNY